MFGVNASQESRQMFVPSVKAGSPDLKASFENKNIRSTDNFFGSAYDTSIAKESRLYSNAT